MGITIKIRKLIKQGLIKGTSKNSISVADLFFFPATSLPKYLFSPAKLRFWRLISEKKLPRHHTNKSY